MSLQLILFVLFGTIAAVSSVLMITRANALISALFLILNFAGLSGLYLTLNAQFIAVTQVIVYAGAIMVLFLFVIMLLKPEHEKYFSHQPKLKIFAFFIAFIVFIQLVFMIFVSHPSQGNNASVAASVAASVKAGTIEEIGKQLYTNYVLPFEAAGYLLLAATIGAIVLGKKKFE